MNKFGAMKDLTFDEFPSSSFDDWMQLVRKELGAQEFDSIVWKNENGFEVVPYLTESVFSSELDFPKHQSLCQQVDGDDPVHVNATLLNCLRGGADAISIGLKIDSYRQLKNVLENIQIEIIVTHFVHEENEAQLVHWIIQYCDEHQINPKNLRGSCAFKQIGNEKCQIQSADHRRNCAAPAGRVACPRIGFCFGSRKRTFKQNDYRGHSDRQRVGHGPVQF
jgi:hypothetical protein